VCTTDPDSGDEGIAMIYVPSPCEGLSFGKFENKAGMQGDRNCSIFLKTSGCRKAFGGRAGR
jgi:alkylation response protein AidB-like acyl-CoA dehydrogenase